MGQNDIGSFHLQILQILVHSHFDLVSWLLSLEATEPVPEGITQMAVEQGHCGDCLCLHHSRQTVDK